VHISIEAIGVDAPIETLEVVDGAFQDPTTSDQVAWYKDTARLDEPGNVVMAAHVNYWGDPEAVFYALDKLQEGDEIVVVAEDGTEYRYAVTSIGLVEATGQTLQEITQETGEQTLTLITCGGTWDPSIQSYLHRTVVQAELVA
jgi:LPXTG-site transpeptidase (sortase) family protein